MNKPGKLIKAALYLEGNTLIGQGQVTLPQIQFEPLDVEGFGAGGSIEVPMRRLQKMEMQVQTTVPSAELISKALDLNSTFRLQCRGAFQTFDALSGTGGLVSDRMDVVLMPKMWNPGTRRQGEGGELEHTFNVYGVAYYVDGVEKLYVDVPAGIYRVDGVDKFAGDRAALGF
jgi:hypothetical protein